MATYTYIEDLINSVKKDEISFRNLHVPAYIKNEDNGDTIKVPYMSLTNKYRDYLEPIITTVPYLLQREKTLFFYRPKALSEFLYGTTELWYGLLEINNMKSIIEFCKEPFKIYDPHKIKPMINEILIQEGILK